MKKTYIIILGFILTLGLFQIEIANAQWDHTTNSPHMFNTNTGRVGVNIPGTTPGRHFEVRGDLLIGSNGGRLFIRRQDNTQHEIFTVDNNNNMVLNRGSIVSGLNSGVIIGLGENRKFIVRDAAGKNYLEIDEASGMVSISADDFIVDGKVTSKEVEVKLDVWPDFVFDDNYDLMSLYDLEAYIQTNRSLPNVPNESEVIENGVNVGEMSAILLQKIEELTLHVIELSKQNSELRDRIVQLEQ